MLLNYLKIAFRTLWNNKVYTSISIFGLGIGLAAFILIFQFVTFELSFDRFHSEHQQIYRLRQKYKESAGYRPPKLPYAAAPTINEDFTAIVDYLRIYINEDKKPVVKPLFSNYQGQIFSEPKTYFSDAHFFDFFDYPLIIGNSKKALSSSHQVVISEAIAEKYFGKNWHQKNILGASFLINCFDTFEEYVVTGVFQKRNNSHFRPDFLLSIPSLNRPKDREMQFIYSHFYSYFKIKDNADISQLTAALSKWGNQHAEYHDLGYHAEYKLERLSDLHLLRWPERELEAVGNKDQIITLFLLGLFILVCAWVNQINITITQSLKRSREVGIRKSLGGKKFSLISQFMIESFIIKLISVYLAVIMVNVFYLTFQNLLGSGITTEFIWHIWVEGLPQFWAFLALLILLLITGTIILGFYPAFILSSYKISNALKGVYKFNGHKSFTLRKSLVTFQFLASGFMVIGTFILYQQINFMLNASLGFDKKHKLIIDPPINDASENNYRNLARQFRREVIDLKDVNACVTSSTTPGRHPELGAIVDTMQNPVAKSGASVSMITVDTSFFDLYQFEFLAGKTFSANEEIKQVIINERLLSHYQIKHPQDMIGRKFYINYDMKITEYQVVGVLKNYHQSGFHAGFGNLVFIPEGSFPYDYSFFTIQLHENSKISSAIKSIENKWHTTFSDIPFTYQFLDDDFNLQYQQDIRFSNTAGIFSLLTIIISCLGLFGLASVWIQHRTKEIGIRKVLGASIGHIIGLLSKTYFQLVIVASIISIPLAWWSIQRILNNYAFKIDLKWWFFVAPLLLLLAIAIFTISVKIIKTAKANPVEALRYE